MNQDIVSLIGQKLIVGFWGTTLEDPWVHLLSRQIEEGKVGGVLFFGYNIENPTQLQKLTHHFASLASPFPLLIAVDEEGGYVSRLNPTKGFSSFESGKKIASFLSSEEAYGYYLGLANKIKKAGFNFNCAPVVDVNPVKSPFSSIIGAKDRSFGNSVETVQKYAKAFIKAHQGKGVLTCLKHFPGHGSVQADSHEDIAVASDWSENELKPFEALIQDGYNLGIMTAHITSALWGGTLATFSSILLREKLREYMRFEGIILSDDLHMGAVGKTGAVEDACIKAIQAGCDMVIVSNNPRAFGRFKQSPSPFLIESIYERMQSAIEKKEVSIDDLHLSFNRICTFKNKISLI